MDLTSRIIGMMAILIYRGCLDFAYVNFSEDFEYYGVIFDPRSPLLIAVSYVVIALLGLVTPLSTDRPSNSLHLLLFLVCLVPSSTLFALNAEHGAGFFAGLAGTFLLIPFWHELLTRRFRFAGTGMKRSYFILALLGIYGGLLAIVASKYGFDSSITSLTDVYGQRATFKAQSGRLSIYTLDWLANVVNLFVALYAVKHRKTLLLVFSLALSVYLFSIGGHKSFLFVAPFTIAIYAVFKLTERRFNLLLILGLAGMVALLVTIDQFHAKGYTLASSLFIRRSLFLPSQIYYHYCEFFSENPLNGFSQNIPFRFFLDSPYQDKLPSIIGETYFTFKDDIYANGNVFADTFAQIGIYSYLLLTFLFPLLYLFMDMVSAEKHKSIAIPFLIMSGHTLLNSGLIVTLVTHGFMLAMLLLLISPPNLKKVVPMKRRVAPN